MVGESRRNIEIKVRLPASELSRIEAFAAEMIEGNVARSTDVDTYFRVSEGRLKLRVSDRHRAGTLIYYERPNEALSRLSHYRLVEIPDAAALRETLTHALGVLVTVKKHRTVFIFGATRIHFDEVEQLGTFIELETVLGTQSYAAALAEHRHVISTLGLDACEIVPESYSDLLLQHEIAS